MPKYRIKRYWTMCDTVEVEAQSVDKAICQAHALSAHGALAEYVPDSINSDPETDVEIITKGAPHG